MRKLLVLTALLASAIGAAQAQPLPGHHPGYLHALTDLRSARWLMDHQPGDTRVYVHEDLGVREIDAAIGEIKHASIDDEKDLHDHPAMDVTEHGSRLLKAIEALKKARDDISGEEDNPGARELRHHALAHVNHALKEAEAAHRDWLKQVR